MFRSVFPQLLGNVVFSVLQLPSGTGVGGRLQTTRHSFIRLFTNVWMRDFSLTPFCVVSATGGNRAGWGSRKHRTKGRQPTDETIPPSDISMCFPCIKKLLVALPWLSHSFIPSSKMIFYHRIESAALPRVDPVTLTQKIKQSQNQIKPARGGAWRRVNGSARFCTDSVSLPCTGTAGLAWLPIGNSWQCLRGGRANEGLCPCHYTSNFYSTVWLSAKRLQSISFVASAMPFEEKLITFRGKTNAVHKMTGISGLSSCLHSFWGWQMGSGARATADGLDVLSGRKMRVLLWKLSHLYMIVWKVTVAITLLGRGENSQT